MTTPRTRPRIRLLILCALLLLLLPLTGCSASSGEKQIFPICLSLDRLPDRRIRLAVQVSSMKEENGYTVFSAAGDSVAQALEILGASMPYPLHFGQLRLCLLGGELLSDGELAPVLRPLGQLDTISPDAAVFAVMGSTADAMAAQQPDLGCA